MPIRLLLAALLLLVPASAGARDRTIMLSTFDSIRVDGPFEVHLTTGSGSGATVSGDVRAIEAVDVHVEGRTLIVAPSLNQWGGWPGERHQPPVITATTPEVHAASVIGGGTLDLDMLTGQSVALTVTGSGRLNIGKVDADQLTAVLAGSGALALSGKVHQARFTNSGTGSIDAADLVVSDLTVSSDGPGQSDFHAERSANITATGLGSITVTGNASCTIRGPGPVHCDRMER
ncbi:head GIN domain-containing protein [Stakelama marina]|uniref:DUF2807 domain-containing protein n=1 Tax=Stakelama marina TaxID=2826939 RepID=A0A8T4IGZ1_9SPHN|nr:head GIN domain-containing protein [Stakelama marina]MBR0553302.1 DUF2807 domain-containing protein [Stakelama marina]